LGIYFARGKRMRLRRDQIFFALLILMIGGLAHSASHPLLSDKSLPLESRLDQLYQKPDLLTLISNSLESPELLPEPVPLTLAKTLELEHLYHPRVQFYLDYFTGPARGNFQIYLNRSALFQDYIQTALKENNLPESLFYLAMIESGLNPYARSRRGAGGIWQFMPGTARRFDLQVDFWVDERRDPDKSTKAAIAYLTELYRRFGSWPLALASYNAGEGKVARIMEKNDSDDYWELIELPGLKQETKDYLPKMIAACIIAESPAEYGFTKPEKQPAPQLEKLLVKDAVDLSKVAEFAGVSYEEIQKMNPALVRGITPPGCKYELNIPPGMGEKLLAAYQQLKPEDRLTYLHHRVKKGDTLSEIGQKYGVSVQELRGFNHLSKISKLKIGQDLIVPVSRGKAGSIISYSQPKTGTGGKTEIKYRVKQGDSLWSIAKSAGVSVEDLRRWNHLKGNVIKVNQVLALYVPTSTHPKSTVSAKAQPKTQPRQTAGKTGTKTQAASSKTNGKTVYEVKPGDTIWKISQIYAVSTQELMEWNNLSTSKIRPGDKIIILAD